MTRKSGSFQVLEQLKHSNIAWFIVFAHGSGGMTVNIMRFVRVRASAGYVVIASDNMSASKFRSRDSGGSFKRGDDLDYWHKNLIYTSDAHCQHAYSIKSRSVLDDPAKYNDFYENVFQARAIELNQILENYPFFIKKRGIFLAGTSEGAMTVARRDSDLNT